MDAFIPPGTTTAQILLAGLAVQRAFFFALAQRKTSKQEPNAKAKGRGRTKLGENRPKRNPASP